MRKKWLIGLFVLLVLIVLGGLAWLARDTPAAFPAELTLSATSTVTATLPVLQPATLALTPTNEPTPGEVRPVSPPGGLATPTKTAKPVLDPTATFPSEPSPTFAPTASAPPVTSTLTVTPCTDMAVDLTTIVDVTMQPGETYFHNWVLMNNGTCTWTPDYSVSWYGGDPLGYMSAVYLDRDVAPGDIVELTVQLIAPLSPGLYPSQWQWLDRSGNQVTVAPGVGLPLMVTVHVQPPPTPGLGTISGRLLLDGSPAPAGVTLTLEDQAYNPLASFSVGSDGSYRFEGVPASDQGYNIVFSQAANPQFSIDRVLSWGWVGPLPLAGGESVQLPDFEIALQGFSQVNPAPDASIPVAAISPATPLFFTWNGHPLATAYWVDLYRGDGQELVWKSALAADTGAPFAGVLSDGSPVQPGEYWWGVGARGALGPYPVTYYGYLSAFVIEP